VRITGQLIDADTGAHLWADRFDGTREDIFDLQDRITEESSTPSRPSWSTRRLRAPGASRRRASTLTTTNAGAGNADNRIGWMNDGCVRDIPDPDVAGTIHDSCSHSSIYRF